MIIISERENPQVQLQNHHHYHHHHHHHHHQLQYLHQALQHEPCGGASSGSCRSGCYVDMGGDGFVDAMQQEREESTHQMASAGLPCGGFVELPPLQ